MRKNKTATRVIIFLTIVIVGMALIFLTLSWVTSPSVQRTSVPAVSVSEVEDSSAMVVEPSAAVEMAIPALDVQAQFEDKPCRLKDGAINPVTMDLACVYTDEQYPYSLPGTESGDIVVIAGHTGALEEGVFDRLYDGTWDRHTVEAGDQLFLRTHASGDQWLVYTATDFHSPEKDGLSTSEEIWGADPMPGRLLTISCVQPANPFAASIPNAVVGWQLEGVTDAPVL